MAIILTDNQHYNDIADAIRSKNGKTTTYLPSEMANAIKAISTSSGGGGGSSNNDEDTLPVMELPSEYQEYVDYAISNLYSGSYQELVVFDYGDWLAVSFLMSDFAIESYDMYSTEFTASGWFTCGYTKSTSEWTTHDFRNAVSTGGNYVGHIKFSSCEIVYNNQKLYPVPVMTEIEITNVSFDDTAGTMTATLATGYSETYTYVYDDSGEVIGVTDSRGHSFTIGGL